jgi:hypothetical protein
MPAKKEVLDIEMTKTPGSLSAAAMEMLEVLTTIRHQLTTVGDYTLVAHLHQPIAKLIVAHDNAVWTICQIDYRTALSSLMELIEARKISIDEIGERTWRFHCTLEEDSRRYYGRTQRTIMS